jgi:hypothetical protein
MNIVWTQYEQKGNGMKRKELLLHGVALLIALVMFVESAPAETTFDYGMNVRARHELWDNMFSLGTRQTTNTNYDRSFFRLALFPWAKVEFDKNVTLYGRMVYEPQYSVGPYKYAPDFERFMDDDIAFDNLYIEWRKAFGLPVDFKIGRQDFLGKETYGDRFLIFDGTPNDGARTNYHNAARARIHFDEKNSLDLLYINNPAYDHVLTLVHARVSRQLNPSNEQGAVAYGRFKPFEQVDLEPYYMYKHEDQIIGQTTPELDLHTIGMRAVLTLGNSKLRGEFAHQFGEYATGRKREGNGGFVIVSHRFAEVALKPEIELGYVYLSGDKNPTSTTAKMTAWNPLFQRAPFFNAEVIAWPLAYEQAKNGGVGYWTNMSNIMVRSRFTFSEQTNLFLQYWHMRANQLSQGLPTWLFSNNSKERGNLVTGQLNHEFSKKLDGFIQAEYFMPGDFYVQNAKNSLFVRTQLTYKF